MLSMDRPAVHADPCAPQGDVGAAGEVAPPENPRSVSFGESSPKGLEDEELQSMIQFRSPISPMFRPTFLRSTGNPLASRGAPPSGTSATSPSTWGARRRRPRSPTSGSNSLWSRKGRRPPPRARTSRPLRRRFSPPTRARSFSSRFSRRSSGTELCLQNEQLMIDSGALRAHRHAAGAGRAKNRLSVGRTADFPPKSMPL